MSLVTRDNRFTRRYEMDGWDRSTEREVDWVSGACMLFPRTAFDEVGGFDEGFPLYAEELDIATRLRAAGWCVLFTPEVELLHAVGVSTGGDRRPHRLVVMHSASLYRYYRAAPGARVASRNLAAGVAGAAGARRDRVAHREGDAPMKAVVLVGGFGTRLRPLTETIKKELLPLVDRPILDHEMDRLLRHGVDEVVMSSPYLEEAFHPFIAARHGEPAITWITESRAARHRRRDRQRAARRG